VVVSNLGVTSLDDLFVETIHVFSAERRFEGNHFIDNTAQGPDVRLGVIGFVLPDLGTGIVGSPGLGVEESVLGDL
jgi:hypothetical protein